MGKYQVIVFFDRDGVLTPSVEILGVPKPMYRYGDPLDQEIKVLLSKLRTKKLCFFAMVTNQPDICRGYRKLSDVIAENEQVAKFFGLNDWEMCAHDSGYGCDCRKPRDGMINKIVRRNELDLSKANVYVIGDRKSDMLLAEKISAIGLFINHNYIENQGYNFDGLKFLKTKQAIEYLSKEIINEY